MPLRSFAAALLLFLLLGAPLSAQCTLVAQTQDLGPGCSLAGDPVIHVYPSLTSAFIEITSGHPHAMGILYASLGPPNPTVMGFPAGLCTVYVNLNAIVMAMPIMTDDNGTFSFS